MSSFADLSRLILPENIVVVGASSRETSQGFRLFNNLVNHSDIRGKVFPVNPAYESINGYKCWPSITSLPDVRIDVVAIIVNASHVIETLYQCVERKIPFAIIMTSGFAEAGEAGKALEVQVQKICKETGLRVYGPNCPGFVNVRDRIGLTFSPSYKDDLNAGTIGLATQGGGLGRNLLQGLKAGQGTALWFSAGNESDLDLPDFIASMANDPKIKVIGLLMEGIKDGKRFIDSLKIANEKEKKVVILKIGRSEAGVIAAQSHTASVAGTASINSAVFRQFGAIEVEDLDELLSVSHMLARGLSKCGNGLAIYTFSGGTAALAADIAGAAGIPPAKLHPQTTVTLKELLPSYANISNPVDTTTDIFRNPDLVKQCLKAICDDPNITVVLFPIPMDYGAITDMIAEAILSVSSTTATLILPIWMSRKMGKGFEMLESNGLLPFFSITDAVAAVGKAFKWDKFDDATSGGIRELPDLSLNRLNEVQAKALLQKQGIVIPSGLIAESVDDAVRHAALIGYPVVMKVVSADVPHKSEAGGVQLNLNAEHDIRQAFEKISSSVRAYMPSAKIEGILIERMFASSGREVLIGVHRDPVFGPVITFGLGGIFVEVIRDVVHRVVPLSREQVVEMIREIKYFDVLKGVRGQAPADLEALESLVFKVSEFANRYKDNLIEFELNPVWVGDVGQGAVALDALVTFESLQLE